MIKIIEQVKGLEVYKILEETGAIMEGHFKLTSGYHSRYYLQCAQLLQHPDITYRFASRALDLITEEIDIKKIDTVVSPAVGGILWGYMLAYIAGCRMVFTERKPEKMQLSRGFELEKNQKVLVAEDVITTGSSVKEVIDICEKRGASVEAVVSIVDRSDGLKFKFPYYYLIKLYIDIYKPSECLMCKEKIPLIYHGSRKKTGDNR
jgi:orotate phosphoribosyltransferase